MRNDDMAVVVNGVRKTYGKGKIVALDDVSFKVRRGEVIGLLGPNGAGKTTMVDILSTLTRPDAGSAIIAGYDVVSEPAGVRRSIMVTGQQVAVDDALSGEQNLVLFGRLWGLSKRRVGTYSGGMRRRIDIACGLVVQPQVAFLDEPTTGLDPRSRQAIWDLVASFKKLGIATLLTTQYLEEADALSDRIILIDHGIIIAEGTANELKHRAGDTFCEIVPRDLKDLDAIVAALGSLLPEHHRAMLTPDSDRITMPAPDGIRMLVEAARRIDEARIELADIALRRPSLDHVFLAMTTDPTESLTHLVSGSAR